jgi:hypothetical protein
MILHIIFAEMNGVCCWFCSLLRSIEQLHMRCRINRYAQFVIVSHYDVARRCNMMVWVCRNHDIQYSSYSLTRLCRLSAPHTVLVPTYIHACEENRQQMHRVRIAVSVLLTLQLLYVFCSLLVDLLSNILSFQVLYHVRSSKKSKRFASWSENQKEDNEIETGVETLVFLLLMGRLVVNGSLLWMVVT